MSLLRDLARMLQQEIEALPRQTKAWSRGIQLALGLFLRDVAGWIRDTADQVVASIRSLARATVAFLAATWRKARAALKSVWLAYHRTEEGIVELLATLVDAAWGLRVLALLGIVATLLYYWHPAASALFVAVVVFGIAYGYRGSAPHPDDAHAKWRVYVTPLLRWALRLSLSATAFFYFDGVARARSGFHTIVSSLERPARPVLTESDDAQQAPAVETARQIAPTSEPRGAPSAGVSIAANQSATSDVEHTADGGSRFTGEPSSTTKGSVDRPPRATSVLGGDGSRTEAAAPPEGLRDVGRRAKAGSVDAREQAVEGTSSRRAQAAGEGAIGGAARRGMAVLRVSSSYEVGVSVDGVLVFTGRNAEATLPLGRHVVSLSSRNFFLESSEIIDLTAGGATLTAPPLATVQIRSRPTDCEISVNGRVLGRGFATLRGAEGSYVVDFRWDSGKKSQRRFDLRNGMATVAEREP